MKTFINLVLAYFVCHFWGYGIKLRKGDEAQVICNVISEMFCHLLYSFILGVPALEMEI
jgi:hypothetical protein